MAPGARRPGKQKHGNDRDRSALLIGAEVLRHAPDRLRDNRDRDDLQPMQRAGADRTRNAGRRHGKDEKHQC